LTDRAYHAKILLFGEQSVLFGSEALSVPFPQFSGRWSVHEHKIDTSLTSLIGKFDQHIINTEQFERDLQEGLFFNSNIPYQYGLGSSGALTAAIYDRYRLHRENTSIADTQLHLANMESVFHGQSSGLDALVSYSNQIIWSHSKRLTLIDADTLGSPIHLYLVDSKTPRSAKRYIAKFAALVDSQSIDIERFNQLVHECISDIVSTTSKTSSDKPFKELSTLQFLNLKAFMPPIIQDLWERGLQDQSYFMKLCGAGGGGYFIVMSPRDNLKTVHGHDLLQIY